MKLEKWGKPHGQPIPKKHLLNIPHGKWKNIYITSQGVCANSRQQSVKNCKPTMASNFVILGVIFSLLLYVLANSNNTGANRRKQRDNELELLKEYEAFEAHATDTITSVIKNQHQEDSCPEDEKDGSGVCQKPIPVSLEGFEHEMNSLLDRTKKIHATLVALLPGKHCNVLKTTALAFFTFGLFLRHEEFVNEF